MDSINKMNFELVSVHPEEEPDINEINNIINNINSDLNYLDSSFIETANKYNDLLLNAKTKINNIKELINIEKERQEDINILCNKFSNFSSVINLKLEDFNTNLSFDNNILSGFISKSERVSYSIDSINGNGYAGNKYVFQNKQFIDDILNTSNKNAINDNNLATSYEYSRITESSSEVGTPIEFNKDSIEAECCIQITCDDFINKLILSTDRNDLILESIYTSSDGINYTLNKNYNIKLNDIYEKYSNQEYIYGSGLLSVPKTKYIKLLLKSNGYTEDTLAYVQTFNEHNNIAKKVKIVSTAKRHVIKINDLSVYKDKYTSGVAISKELITNEPITYIALYCNQYAEDKDMVKYSFIINGKEYEIKPINSNENGKKIIRTSTQTYKLDNTEYITESIKSAMLKIDITTSDYKSPFISNIKVLIGSDK